MALKEIEYNNKKFQISYTIVGDSKKSIVFLHGWGSNKEVMKGSFGNKLKDFKHIYIDLPGFGSSPNSSNVLTTKDYANIVKIFLDKIRINPDIIAGHSFGGKVATLLNPQKLVLLSSAGILVPKPINVKLKIAIVKLLKPFKIQSLIKLFVSKDAKDMNLAMYETFKNVVDEYFEDNFKKYSGKALLFWGKEDSATPLWSGEKISKLIQNSKFYPLDGDHFFFVNNSNFIAQTIEQEF
jgi:pimeloyl-ACP methyl ester carboxylesterase